MGIKKYKPFTPGRRHMTGYDFSEITTNKPYKPLTVGISSCAGRSNTTGSMTIRHKGGGHKRKYRIIDFKQLDKMNIPAVIETIEYDPNRSARIALLKYADGERRYILLPLGMKVGDSILCAKNVKVKLGHRMPIGKMVEGTVIHNIELIPGKGGSIVRSAGSSATVVSLKGDRAQIKLPSGQVRLVHKECFATVGIVNNQERARIVIGKAGRNRWLGKRPVVRGKAMNVREHPHGSGEGGCPIGMKYPKTPWGKHALGVKTRKNKRTNVFILSK